MLQQAALKAKLIKLSEKCKRFSEEVEILQDKVLAVERANKLVLLEKDKMKQRI